MEFSRLRILQARQITLLKFLEVVIIRRIRTKKLKGLSRQTSFHIHINWVKTKQKNRPAGLTFGRTAEVRAGWLKNGVSASEQQFRLNNVFLTKANETPLADRRFHCFVVFNDTADFGEAGKPQGSDRWELGRNSDGRMDDWIVSVLLTANRLARLSVNSRYLGLVETVAWCFVSHQIEAKLLCFIWLLWVLSTPENVLKFGAVLTYVMLSFCYPAYHCCVIAQFAEKQASEVHQHFIRLLMHYSCSTVVQFVWGLTCETWHPSATLPGALRANSSSRCGRILQTGGRTWGST